MSARNFVITFSFLVTLIMDALAITCYECTGGQGQDCKYTGTTCSYGLFGCMKMTVYSGGVDKLGNFYDEESKIVSMARGCTFLPIGGVDACQQTVFAGYRMVTCYCFTDYCNSSTSLSSSHILVFVSLCVSSLIAKIDHNLMYTTTDREINHIERNEPMTRLRQVRWNEELPLMKEDIK
ncbi:hypothetical protein QR680_002197 [Steinernema hermaphroditum]|uniref:Protein sleepless n=1 Tax=Steinernema hermaphroditum TaxID=289476 RepID=A0AA39H3W0_9BILA|nr:hypothetical protein QR680_002197 [Steinernema hermaphroditum]